MCWQQRRQACPTFRAIFTRMTVEGYRMHQAVNGAKNLTYYSFSPRGPRPREEEHIRSWPHREGWVILLAPAALEIERSITALQL